LHVQHKVWQARVQMGQHHAPEHLSYSCFQWPAVIQLS